MTTDVEGTVVGRLSQYRRRQRLITWIGGGLLAEITIYAAIRFSGETCVPTVLTNLVPTFVLIGGFMLALARVQFEWRADLLERHISLQTIKPADTIEGIDSSQIKPKDLEWPKWGELFYIIELVFALAGGISLILLIWWP